MVPYMTYTVQNDIPVEKELILDESFKPTDYQSLQEASPCFPTNRPLIDTTYKTIEQEITFPQPSYRPPEGKKMLLIPFRQEYWKTPEHDTRKFSDYKKENDIKMTNYKVGSRLYSYFVCNEHRIDYTTPKRRYRTVSLGRKGSSVVRGTWQNTPSNVDVWETELTTTWVGTPPNGCSRGPYVYFKHSVPFIKADKEHRKVTTRNFDYTFLSHVSALKFVEPDLSNAIRRVRIDCVNDVRGGFDVLTNVLEAPKSLVTLKSLMSDVVRLTKHVRESLSAKDKKAKFFRNLSKEGQQKWMEYRYGIMPVVYSLQDFVESLEKAAVTFRTGRAKYVHQIKFSPSLPELLPQGTVFDVVEGTVTIQGTAKAKFGDPLSSAAYSVTVNPFLTGWELIPLSFVLDWFVQIGDWIENTFSSMMLSAFNQTAEEKGCYSVKMDYTLNRYVVTVDETYRDNKLESSSKRIQLVERHDVNTYERKVFDPYAIELPTVDFDPYRNWRRVVDSYIIFKKPFIRSLRSLK